MDMVEKVARAIADADQEDYIEDFQRYARRARAAIGAMREPTDAMLDAALDMSGMRVAPYEAPRESGVAVECDLSEEDAASINEGTTAAQAEIYSAMIDAALNTDKSREGA